MITVKTDTTTILRREALLERLRRRAARGRPDAHAGRAHGERLPDIFGQRPEGQSAPDMRLPLTSHFCAEKWHLDLVCRIVSYLSPFMQGFSQHLAVMVLYIISSVAPVPSLQCYPATWFSDAPGDVYKLWTACHAEKHVASQVFCVLACFVTVFRSLFGAFRIPFVAWR